MSNSLPQSSEAVRRAARWLATIPQEAQPHPIVPVLRRQFDLTALEACEAIREARLIQARAH